MESLGQDKVFQEDKVKQVREQIKSEKEQTRIEKKEQRDSRSPLKKLISYIELGGIVLLVSLFRKPLLKLGGKIFKDIDEEVEKITTKIVTEIEDTEIKIRNAVIESYFMDPIQCYRIGGDIYTQLIDNGGWDKTVYTHFDAVPATVTPKFTIGTGAGTLNVRNTLVRGLSVQIIGMSEYMIASGQKLST